jgi:hypothetical protein
LPPRTPYAELFAAARRAVDTFFGVTYANAYDGRIDSDPSAARRWLAFPGVRHRVAVSITVADQGGYWLEVKVYRERRLGGRRLKGGEVAWGPAGRAPVL